MIEKILFIRRSLRFQILAITIAILLIPVLIMLYDIFYATRVDEIHLLGKQEQLAADVQFLAGRIATYLEGKLTGEENTADRHERIRQGFNEIAGLMAQSRPGLRLGLYFPDNQQIFVQGFLHNYRKLSPSEQMEREKRVLQEASSGLIAVAASKKPLARIIESLGDQTMEYLAPVVIHGELVAVVWGDERLHPLFVQSRNFRLVTRYFTLAGFFLGALGTLLVIHNLTTGVGKLKEGLKKMEGNVQEMLPVLPGEVGEIAQAINKMALAVAEKEKLEQELQRSERLAALGRVVTGVAHELRNPIGIIKATVQVMEKEMEAISSLNEFASVIKEQVDRQNKVIQELLDYGRPGKPLIQSLSINALLKSILTFTEPLLKQHQINLEQFLSDDIPLIEVDGEKIKQVFVNLILNAVQSMLNGGSLIIKTRKENCWIYIEFVDNGEGIPEENIASIFDPFFTTREEGTGLGLAISHRLVTMHGGIISVESKKGWGSKFTVKLPVARSTLPPGNVGVQSLVSGGELDGSKSSGY